MNIINLGTLDIVVKFDNVNGTIANSAELNTALDSVEAIVLDRRIHMIDNGSWDHDANR